MGRRTAHRACTTSSWFPEYGVPRSQIRSANVGAAGFRDQERHELLDRWGLYDPAGIEQRKAAGRAAFVRQDLDELSPRELACDRELIGLREASAGPRQRDRAKGLPWTRSAICGERRGRRARYVSRCGVGGRNSCGSGPGRREA